MNTSFNSESSSSFILEEEPLPEIPYTLITTISSSLSNVISHNPPHLPSSLPNPFLSNPLPQISISEYLSRICHYTNLSKETLICALIYIDSICSSTSVSLNERTVHKIMLAAILLSIKYNEDKIYSMSYYAEIFGISKEELMKLELAFITEINFNLYIKEEVYLHYEQSVENGNGKGKEEEEMYISIEDRNTMESWNELVL